MVLVCLLQCGGALQLAGAEEPGRAPLKIDLPGELTQAGDGETFFTADKAPPVRTGGETHVDQHGDALPRGAELRLGTLRWRHPYGNYAVSPDGTLVAVALQEQAFLLDTRDGRQRGVISFGCRRPYEGKEYFDDIARAHCFSPDGKLLAFAFGDYAVQLVDVKTGKLVRTLLSGQNEEPEHHDRHDALLFSRDGRSLAWRMDSGEIRVFDLETGRPGEKLDGYLPQGNGAELVALDVRERGRDCRVIDLRTGERLRSFKGPELDVLDRVAVSGDGRTAAFSSGGKVHIWDTVAGRELHAVAGAKAHYITTLAFGPDNARLTASTWNEDGTSTCLVWDVQTGRELWSTSRDDLESRGCAFLDSDRLAVIYEAGARVYELSSGRMLVGDKNLDGEGPVSVIGVRFLADGKSIARVTMDGVDLWDAAAGKRLRSLIAARETERWSWGRCGRRQVIALYDAMNGIRVCNLAKGAKVQTIEPDPKLVLSLAVSGDARHLATVLWNFETRERKLVEWNLVSNSAVKQWPDVSGTLLGLPFADDAFAISRRDRGVEVWDFKTTPAEVGKASGIISLPDYARGLATSADGSLLVVGLSPRGAPYSKFVVYETASGRPVYQSPEYPRFVRAVAISDDGRYIAWCTGERVNNLRPAEAFEAGVEPPAIRVFDLVNDRELARFTGFLGVPTDLSFSPNGRRLVSSHTDSTCLVWELPASASSTELDLDTAWEHLAGDATAASRAVWRFADAQDRGARFLADRLRPAEVPDGNRVAELIADLDAEGFETRERATADLRQLGPAVADALRKAAAQSHSPEQGDRCRLLLKGFDAAFTTDPEQLRPIRAVYALQRIGTPAAREVLSKLASGAAAVRQTRHAKLALARMAEPD